MDAPVPERHVRPGRPSGHKQIDRVASQIDPHQTGIEPLQNRVIRHSKFPCWMVENCKEKPSPAAIFQSRNATSKLYQITYFWKLSTGLAGDDLFPRKITLDS